MNKFILFATKRPVGVFLVMLLIALWGVFAYKQLPVSDLPSVGYPVIVVSAFYPGASPETMGQAVATPLEEELMRISGIKNIVSQSSSSFTKIILTFDSDKNADLLVPDIQKAVNMAKGNMPVLPSDPTIQKYNPSEKPIMFLTLDSDSISHEELFDIANKKISQPLSIIKGVSNVSIYSVSGAIRINVNPLKLAKLDLTMPEVSNAVYSNTLLASGGSLNGDWRNYAITPDGQLTKPQEYNNIIIKTVDGQPIKISDIGKAALTPQQENYRLNFYDKKTDSVRDPILLAVTKKDDANIVKVANAINSQLNSIQKDLGNNAKISVLYNKAKDVKVSIWDMKITLFASLVLVILLIVLFTGKFRNSLIIAITLPLSILITFVGMHHFGFSIDNLSLIAITVAVGFVVDDAIVMIDNIIRHMKSGRNAIDSTLLSIREVSASIVAMTLAIAIVFIPLVFMGGVIGETFRELTITVIILVITSCIISLILTPILSARNLRIRENISRIDNMFTYLVSKYERCLAFALNHKILTLVIWLVCIVLSIALFFILPKTFLPAGDSGTILGAIHTPIGTAEKPIQKYQSEINKVLKKNKNIDSFYTITGMTTGADMSMGALSINLKDKNSRKSITKEIDSIRKSIEAIPYNIGSVYLMPAPTLAFSVEGNTTAQGTRYSYMLTSSLSKNVFKLGQRFRDVLSQQPGFTDVQSDVKFNLPKLKLEIDRNKAQSLGISVSDIQSTLLSSYSLGRTTQFIVGPNHYDVILQIDDKYRKSEKDLSMIYLRSSVTGKLVSLDTIATVEESVEPSVITHYKNMNAVTISFNLKSGYPIGDAIKKVEALAKKNLPSSISGEFQGEAQQFVATTSSFKLFLVIAIVLMYILLGILYESFIHPFTIITTLPVAMVGGFGALYLCNSTLSIFSYLGLLFLLGIVAKNGIMLVDFALQKIKRENKDSVTAIKEACLIRFKPITITGLTSIIATVPIALGLGADGYIRQPLGIVIVGGLVVSQVLTLFVTPVIFLLMEKIRRKS